MNPNNTNSFYSFNNTGGTNQNNVNQQQQQQQYYQYQWAIYQQQQQHQQQYYPQSHLVQNHLINPYMNQQYVQQQNNMNNLKRPFDSTNAITQTNVKKRKTKNDDDLPIDLVEYMERSREDYKSNPAHLKSIDKMLANIVQDAKMNGTLYTANWKNMVLPRLQIPSYTQVGNYIIGEKNKNKKKKKKQTSPSVTLPISDPGKLAQRKARFEKRKFDSGPKYSGNNTLSKNTKKKGKFQNANIKPVDFALMFQSGDLKVVGTCTNLEKTYLRVTSAPDPSTIRPEHVLIQAFQHVKRKWRNTHDWDYANDQLKSMRQDLMLQNIKNDFTVRVYELHARLCLENDNLGEFSSCQSQLIVLYAMGLPGSIAEFTAYRILHAIHNEDGGLLLSHIVNTIPQDLLEEECIKHALDIRKVVEVNNYHKFFKLYPETPNMGRYILDKMLDPLRINAVEILTKCYRPSLDIKWVSNQLGFGNLRLCISYLLQHKCELSPNQRVLKCKESSTGLKEWQAEENAKIRRNQPKF